MESEKHLDERSDTENTEYEVGSDNYVYSLAIVVMDGMNLLPLNVFESRRNKEGQSKVHDPVRARREPSGVGSHGQREYLGNIQPRDRPLSTQHPIQRQR